MSPNPTDQPAPDAAFGRRAAAFAIDVVLVWGALSMLGALLTVRAGLVIMAVLVLILLALYDGILTAQVGWTVGKRALALESRGQDGAPLTPGAAMARAAVRTVSILPLGLGLFWAVWDSANETWHDKLLKARVLQGPKPERVTGGPRPAAQPSGWVWEQHAATDTTPPPAAPRAHPPMSGPAAAADPWAVPPGTPPVGTLDPVGTSDPVRPLDAAPPVPAAEADAVAPDVAARPAPASDVEALASDEVAARPAPASDAAPEPTAPAPEAVPDPDATDNWAAQPGVAFGQTQPLESVGSPEGAPQDAPDDEAPPQPEDPQPVTPEDAPGADDLEPGATEDPFDPQPEHEPLSFTATQQLPVTEPDEPAGRGGDFGWARPWGQDDAGGEEDLVAEEGTDLGRQGDAAGPSGPDPNHEAIRRAGLVPDMVTWMEQVADQVGPRLERVNPGWRSLPQHEAARACAFGLLLGSLGRSYPHVRPQLVQVAEAHPSFSTLASGSRLGSLERLAGDPRHAAAWLGPLVEVDDTERVARLLD